jgi:UDP-N-acetylglucosamine/UDP-N-acetylgalactosamine diphosphorylase
MMKEPRHDLRAKLRAHGQEHVLAWWDRLTDVQRQLLQADLRGIDLAQLQRLYESRDQLFTLPGPEQIRPIDVVCLTGATPADEGRLREAHRLGQDALRAGEVAALVVAGGQGSRLGFEHPKGMFPIGPISNKSLFQLHAEKVLASSRRYGKPVPFLVMTSPTNHGEVVGFFQEHRHFGLPVEDVFFFSQGTMPAVDLATGKLLLELPHRLFLSPNGHGGTITALADTGLLDRLRRRGVRDIFYWQVDNPVVRVADPVFLGYHRQARAQVSSKAIPKNRPNDKLGNLVLIDGRCSMIEYSDMPAELARQRDAQGRLRFWVGSPAIHIFDVDFLTSVTQSVTRLPFHLARKKVPYLDENANLVQPAQENALKFEMFIFDVLPMAERWTVVETTRREEFEPVKNATGPDSPATARQAISDLAAEWLEQAGAAVPRTPEGHTAFPLEISPLYALDAEGLASRVDRSLRVEGPLYLL